MASDVFRLTEGDVERFQADGFLFAERLIDRQTVRLLRKRFVHLFRGEFATGIRPDEVNWQEGTGDLSLTRQICNGWKADPAIARVVLRADLGPWPTTRTTLTSSGLRPRKC